MKMVANLSCPAMDEATAAAVRAAFFWSEGVALTAVAALGLACNAVLSALILSHVRLRGIPFNLLLVVLAGFDAAYLAGAVLESVRRVFGAATQTHLRLFPHVLYPLHGAALSGSIFMTAAISLERYAAVHHHIDYRRAMSDGAVARARLVRFGGPVAVAAVAFSLPRFFEMTLAYDVSVCCMQDDYV